MRYAVVLPSDCSLLKYEQMTTETKAIANNSIRRPNAETRVSFKNLKTNMETCFLGCFFHSCLPPCFNSSPVKQLLRLSCSFVSAEQVWIASRRPRNDGTEQKFSRKWLLIQRKYTCNIFLLAPQTTQRTRMQITIRQCWWKKAAEWRAFFCCLLKMMGTRRYVNEWYEGEWKHTTMMAE